MMINWFTVAIVFLNLWWLIFFMTLPFGIRQQERVQSGNSTGAPANPNLGIKAIITTVLAALGTAVFFYLTSGGVLVPAAA